MKNRVILIILPCLLLFVGCSSKLSAGKVTNPEEATFISMEEEPVLSYEVPVSIPGILVNQLGYTTGSTKMAVFHGDEMPDLFYLVDAETNKVVYTGIPEERENKSLSGEYYCYGDFSEWIKTGNYYIEAPVLGRSYTFIIGDNIYDSLFAEACRQYYFNRCGMTLTKEYAGESAHNACHTGKAILQTDTSISLDVTGGWHQDEKGQKNVLAAAKTMSTLLMAYELYPDAFTDDIGIPESGNGVPDILDEIKYEADWLLKMQHQETGAVYAGISVYAKGGDASSKEAEIYVEPASFEAGKAFAMALAKFSYLYQYYDTEYATNCLKAADRAWKYAELNEKEKITDSITFAAATELYRASGEVLYTPYIIDCLREDVCGNEWNEITLTGAVTYISTKHVVNIEYCEKLIGILMSHAEEISHRTRETVYLTSGNEQQGNNGELLFDMMCLSVVNRIISNHEYETIIENHLHYFMGRNETAYNHIADGAGIMKQFEADSKFVFMISEIMENGR